MKSKIPLDLVIVFTWMIATIIVVFTPILEDSPIRNIVGIPMILFIPGYVTVAALFPKKDLDNIERIALSLGLSIAIISLLGLALNLTLGLDIVGMIILLSSYIIILILIAKYRRKNLSEDEFTIQFKSNDLVQKLKPKDMADLISTIILISMMALAIVLSFYVLEPKMGQKFTELYVINSYKDIDIYPTDLKSNNPTTLIIGISNHEYSPINYTLQTVLDENVLSSEDIFLEHNQTLERDITFSPNKIGNGMRLEFLLYKDHDFSNPYRTLYLWINSS